MIDSATLLRQARSQAGLTQSRLAEAAGVTQSVISAYELGRRQPSWPMLNHLIAAAGSRLVVRLEPETSGERVLRLAPGIRQLAELHGYTRIHLFGSVARGEETTDSDIDFLVEGQRSLIDLAGLQLDLTELLGRPVDVVPIGALKAGSFQAALAEAVAL